MTLIYNLTIFKGCKNYKGLLYNLCYNKLCEIVDLFYFIFF